MEPKKKLLKTATVTIAVIATAICSLYAQEIRKMNMQWKGKSIQVAEERIVVKVHKDISKVELINKTQSIGFEIIDGPDEMGLALVRVPKGISIQDAIGTAKSFDEIEGAEPIVATYVSVSPNDQYYGNQWGLLKINSTFAWDITTGSSNIILGVLDTGIPMQNNALSHPDLQNSNRIILGNDYVGDGQSVRDRNGHGTHVVGIASAETNNSIGVSGVSWNTKNFVVQVFDSLGSGYDYYFYQGVVNAVDNGARVINYSGGQMVPSYFAEAGVQYAQSHGVILVVAAGNYHPQRNPDRIVEWPAAYSTTYNNVISVSATNSSDVIADFSSRGPEIIVAAPGDGIYSTLPNYPNYHGYQNYGNISGTSMAAPHVAGLAALMLSVNSSITPSQIRTLLQQTADDKGPSGFDNEYGYGRINAFKAVAHAYVLANPIYTFTIDTAPLMLNQSNINMSFLASPAPGLAAGSYSCDRYIVDVTSGGFAATPQAWYTAPYGYSWANPNSSIPYLLSEFTSSSVHYQTVFYYLKVNLESGQTINRWAPFDPNAAQIRGYCTVPHFLDQLLRCEIITKLRRKEHTLCQQYAENTARNSSRR